MTEILTDDEKCPNCGEPGYKRHHVLVDVVKNREQFVCFRTTEAGHIIDDVPVPLR